MVSKLTDRIQSLEKSVDIRLGKDFLVTNYLQ